MRWRLLPSVFLALGLGLAATRPARAQPVCALTQITDAVEGDSWDPSLDGGSIAFVSEADLTGGNPEGNPEIFFYDGATIRQITQSDRNHSEFPSLDQGAIAFRSEPGLIGDEGGSTKQIYLYDGSTIRRITPLGHRDAGPPSLDDGSVAFGSRGNLTGENPDETFHLFLYDGVELRQISQVDAHTFFIPSLDGGSIAFASSSDLTGDNPDGDQEIFLYDGSGITQITDSSSFSLSQSPSLDGGSIAFSSDGNFTGANLASYEIFLYDGSAISQITDASVFMNSESPSLDGRAIAFLSDVDHTGENEDESDEVFLFDGSSIVQVTRSNDPGGRIRHTRPSLDAGAIAFASNGDLTGGNPDGSWEVFLASCPAVAPPSGPFLSSDEIPDFRFKVRITARDQGLAGKREQDCLAETLCVSGALPGRSELFLRMIGPRPNGFLWANLVRFTPSRVEVWVEQISSGRIQYYDLPALPRDETELTGLVDKDAFSPLLSGAATASSIPSPAAEASGLAAPAQDPGLVAWQAASFTSDEFPGHRFTVRILSGGEEQPARLEHDCIPETICVSGALPGRSELFIRILGPRPNGFLWVNLVRFTTSRVEVEIEQLSTGERRSYVLAEVPRASGDLSGRVDKEAFLP